MFNRITGSFKGAPDAFSLTLGYAPADGREHSVGDGALTKEASTVQWVSTETEDEILKKVTAAAKDPEVRQERVAVQLHTGGGAGGGAFWGVVSAAASEEDVQLGFQIQASRPPLVSVELLRAAGGTVSTSLAMSIWGALDLAAVTRLRCNEGIGSLWDRSLLSRLSSLRVLNLSHANMTALPGVVSELTSLQELRLVGNSLKILPPEIGKLTNLRVLAVDSNELSILPGELRRCAALEEFTLENNRLTSVLLNFGSLRQLRVLHLSGNPLEFLPEIAPCAELRNLTVANLRVSADRDYREWKVDLSAPPGPSSTISIGLFDSSASKSDKLRPIFSLMLRRSTGHHPLLAGAFRSLAEEDPKNRDLMAKQENALQQLILMALNDDSVVVAQTCRTLALLARHSPALATAILDADAGSLRGLLRSDDTAKQVASLEVMAAVSLSLGDNAPNRLLSAEVVAAMLGLATDGNGAPELRAAALTALGNLAFSPAGKAWLGADARAMDALLRLAESGKPLTVKSAAIRALAILGDVQAVGRAVGRPPPPGRGLRVLSMDGGGMKGMATVRLLRELENRTGKPIHALFDLIVGTSTGGLLAVSLGLRKFSLDDCERIYKVLGQRVFSRPTAAKEKEESWAESFYRAFHSKTQHVRAVVVGYKHDASVYEALLKEYCCFAHDPRCPTDALIDTACMDVPKVALVSTLASTSPAVPFVFRNYELPPEGAAAREAMCFQAGSSRHEVWQAVRASSAAIYYLDDFNCGGDKFQDGAVLANNPGMIALQEARALWPDTPIDVFVSVGTGSTPVVRREKGMSSFIDTGNIVIESATNVERVHEALATVTPLMPGGMRYFRFNALDPRCRMELDEIDPEKWAVLEEATDDFVKETDAEFEAAAAALVGAAAAAAARTGTTVSPVKAVKSPRGPAPVTLGLHRGLAVCTAGPLSGEPSAAELAAAAACARLPGCSARVDLQAAAETGVRHAREEKAEEAAAAAVPAVPAPSPVGEGSSGPVAVIPEPIAAGAAASTAATVEQGPAVVEVDISSALGSVFSWFSPSKTARTSPPASPPPGPSPPPAAEAVTPPPAQAPRVSPSPASHPIVLSPGAGGPGASPAPLPPKVASRTAAAADQQPKGCAELLAESIQGALPPVGVVLLSLRAASAGLVLRWRDSFAAVTVPSDEADELVRQAGYDPATTSLSELFDRGSGVVTLGVATLTALTKQYRRGLGGELISVILAQYTSPEEVLDGASIEKMESVWAGKVVITADRVPPQCLAAFKAAGVLAVVEPAQPLDECSGCTAAALGAFWAGLYDDLREGRDLVAAVRRAEEAQPQLDGAFRVHMA